VKMVSLTSWQTKPRFQDARNVSSSVKSQCANLYTRPTKLQLEDKLLRTLHARHNASYAGVGYRAWRLGAIELKRPGDPHHPGWQTSLLWWQSCGKHARMPRHSSLKATVNE
jgi:hypothetical protein